VAPPLPRWLKGLAAALLLFTHVYVLQTQPRFLNPNEVSRVHLTLAIASERTLSIDPLLKLVGTEDRSVWKGRYFSDKAPGTSLWLVPFAWLFGAIRGHAPLDVPGYLGLMYALRVAGLSVPAVAFWLAGIRWYRTWTGSEAMAAVVVLAGALGTSCFIYATHVFGVVPCGAALFAAFMAVRASRAPSRVRTRRGVGYAAAAGALAGSAFLFDPLAAFSIPVLGVFTASVGERRAWRTAGYALGLVAPVAAWMAYNTACFGHPLQTGIHHHAEPGFAERYAQGFMGFSRPDPAGWLGIWFSGRRGLLFLSPFLAVAIPGWVRMARVPTQRADAVVCVAVTVATYLFALVTIDWMAGWAVGPRYLVPAIPFLLVGVAAALRPGRGDPWVAPVAGLAIASSAALAVCEVGFPAFPHVFANPLVSLAWPLVRSGCVTPAFRSGTAPVLPLILLAVHVLAAAGLLGYLACRRRPEPGRRALSVVGFTLVGALVFASVREPPGTLPERAEKTALIRGYLGCPEVAAVR